MQNTELYIFNIKCFMEPFFSECGLLSSSFLVPSFLHLLADRSILSYPSGKLKVSAHPQPECEQKSGRNKMEKAKENTMNKRLLIAGFLISAFILLGASQEDMGKGRITGTVADENGAPVEGALIVAQSLRSQTKLEGRTDGKGKFAIAGLGTDGGRITASKGGYGGLS